MITMGQAKKAWNDKIFFEEYPTNPHSYTLNGFMFALLGIYDWSQTSALSEDERKSASEYFRRGVETLDLILPLYDFNGMSSYDLSHLTAPGRRPQFTGNYHGVHIELLAAIHSITSDPLLLDYEQKWRSYVADLMSDNK